MQECLLAISAERVQSVGALAKSKEMKSKSMVCRFVSRHNDTGEKGLDDPQRSEKKALWILDASKLVKRHCLIRMGRVYSSLLHN